MREGREGREYWMDRGNRPDARYLPAPGTLGPDSRYSRYFGPETSRREKKVVVEEAPYEGPTIFDKAGSSCLLSWLLSSHVSFTSHPYQIALEKASSPPSENG